MKEPLFSVTKKDFEVVWFSGKGAGGQHRNKHQNCCRIFHKDSGAVGIGQNHRERTYNQRDALNSLVASEKFQTWVKLKVGRSLLDESEIERKVEKEMENIKVEVFEDGKWVEEN